MDAITLGNETDKVLKTAKDLYSTFEGTESDFMIVAIMAGLQGAYAQGLQKGKLTMIKPKA